MHMDSRHAVVVLSGGQDSCTCLGWALTEFDTVSCVTFHYGQKHQIEVDAALKIVAEFEKLTGRKIRHEVVTVPPLAGTSPLTNPGEELETYTDHDSMAEIIGDRIEKTFVPMRNAIFLMIAANRAAA